MASGQTLVVFHPQDNEPPASNYATLDERNGHIVLDFDSATQETAVFTAVMPRGYGGGGVTVSFNWAATSATTGTGSWDGSFERIGAAVQDLDGDGFAAAVTAVVASVPTTSGHVAISSVAFSDGAAMDSIAVGDVFRFRARRDTANDNASGDLELLAIEIRET